MPPEYRAIYQEKLASCATRRHWDWIAREYVFGDEPRTEIGRADREFSGPPPAAARKSA